MRIAVAAASAALLTALFAGPAAAETKIGVISELALRAKAPQVQSAGEKFKAEFQKREDELKAEARKLDEDSKRYQREGDAMSAQQRATTAKDLYTRQTDFELKRRQYEEQAQTRNAELQRDVVEKINQAIREVAAERGLDLVISSPAFATDALDITGEVLKKLAAMEANKPAAADPKKKKK